MQRPNNILIAGSGLSAAFAIQAAKDCGIKPENIDWVSNSQYQKSFGAIWLHFVPINAITEGGSEAIYISKIGTKVGYLNKQWHSSEYETSFPYGPRIDRGYIAEHFVENMFSGVNLKVVQDISDNDLLNASTKYSLVFHTFPSKLSKMMLKKYIVKFPIYVEAGGPYREFLDDCGVPDDVNNFILYDGEISHNVVRTSILGEYMSIEYTSDTVEGDIFRNKDYEHKIVWATDLHPDTPKWNEKIASNVYPIGRFAKWERKYLSHMAHWDVFWAVKENIMK